MLVTEVGPGYKVINGPWFSFRDVNGLGYAQPDHLLIGEDEVILLESKLTQTNRGLIQLKTLYRPLIEYAFAPLPIRSVMVCKNLRVWTKSLVSSLEKVLSSQSKAPLIFHWIG